MATIPPKASQASRPARSLWRRSAYTALTVIAVLAAGAGGWVYWRVHACLPRLDGTIQVEGLQGKVEVVRDAHGVPHIRAASLEDLMFAQGYVTAQDRLWQMDLSRRIAQGRLSELFGSRTLHSDIENRSLGMQQAAERAVKDLDPEEQKLLTDYARGVNAFIRTHQNRLPIEFLLLRYHPNPWKESDSLEVALNMARLLNTSWPDELMRERVRSKLGNPQLESDIFPAGSPLDHPVAESLPGSVSPAAIRHAISIGPQPRILDSAGALMATPKDLSLIHI